MTITNAAELKTAIAQLEQQRIDKEMELLYDLKAYSQEIKDTLVNITMGVGSGIVAKKLVTGNKSGVIANIAGNLIKGIVATGVTSNAEKIKAVGTAIWKNFFTKNHQ